MVRALNGSFNGLRHLAHSSADLLTSLVGLGIMESWLVEALVSAFMNTFSKLVGATTLSINVYLMPTGAAIAAPIPVSPQITSTPLRQNTHLVSGNAASPKPATPVKNGGGYQPPPDTGAPGTSQGSGTR